MAKKKKKSAASKSSGVSEIEETRRRFAEAFTLEQQQQQPQQQPSQSSTHSDKPQQQASQPKQQPRQSKAKPSKSKAQQQPDEYARFATFGQAPASSSSSRRAAPTLSARSTERLMDLYNTAVRMDAKNATDPKSLALTVNIVDMIDPHPDGSIMGATMDELDEVPMKSLSPELQMLKRGFDMTVTKTMLGTVPPGVIPPGGIGPVMMAGDQRPQCTVV